mmetsp:Transcript_66064/g.157991  ORF Transcript_66064/g.157991 Transcript_66064/m.157991 type:complete len:426 (+) Transcript_66064:48-1325(+)
MAAAAVAVSEGCKVARLPSKAWSQRNSIGCREAGSASSRRRLSDISEQRVLKTGIRRIRDIFVPQDVEGVLQLPTRKNGTSMLLRPAFVKKLLNHEIELQSAMAADISAAQSDIKHLSLVQLLELRARTLDFVTDSRSHEAHKSFLSIVDNHLFAQVAYRLREQVEGMPKLQRSASNTELYQKLGYRIALTVGAVLIFAHGMEAASTPKANSSVGLDSRMLALPTLPEAEQEATELSSMGEAEKASVSASDGTASCSIRPSHEPLPRLWALGLDPAEWSDLRIAFLDPWALSLKVVGDCAEDIVTTAGSQSVAIIWDRSSGMGKDRSMHWEVAAISGTGEDILFELDRSERGTRASSFLSRSGTSSSPLADELKAAFSRRSLSRLGSEESPPSSGGDKAVPDSPSGAQTPSTRASTNPGSPAEEL